MIAKTESILVICWDCAGDDATILQQELTGQLDNLRQELNGKIDTETRKLQDQISNLQKALNDAIVPVLKDPATDKKFRAFGALPAPTTPAEYQSLIDEEAKKYKVLVEIAGARVD